MVALKKSISHCILFLSHFLPYPIHLRCQEMTGLCPPPLTLAGVSTPQNKGPARKKWLLSSLGKLAAKPQGHLITHHSHQSDHSGLAVPIDGRVFGNPLPEQKALPLGPGDRLDEEKMQALPNFPQKVPTTNVELSPPHPARTPAQRSGTAHQSSFHFCFGKGRKELNVTRV